MVQYKEQAVNAIVFNDRKQLLWVLHCFEDISAYNDFSVNVGDCF